jgi:hypothetical protein
MKIVARSFQRKIQLLSAIGYESPSHDATTNCLPAATHYSSATTSFDYLGTHGTSPNLQESAGLMVKHVPL